MSPYRDKLRPKDNPISGSKKKDHVGKSVFLLVIAGIFLMFLGAYLHYQASRSVLVPLAGKSIAEIIEELLKIISDFIIESPPHVLLIVLGLAMIIAAIILALKPNLGK